MICNTFTNDSYDHMNCLFVLDKRENIKWYIPIHCWLQTMILNMAYEGIGFQNDHNLFPL
jgi:hypothetical protein